MSESETIEIERFDRVARVTLRRAGREAPDGEELPAAADRAPARPAIATIHRPAGVAQLVRAAES